MWDVDVSSGLSEPRYVRTTTVSGRSCALALSLDRSTAGQRTGAAKRIVESVARLVGLIAHEGCDANLRDTFDHALPRSFRESPTTQ